MRRLHTRLAAVAAVALLAQPTPTPPGEGAEPPPEPVPGEPACSITDPRLLEISGLVAFDDGGYAVVNDSTLFADRKGVFFLDQDCQVQEQIGYPTPELDPEALAWDREANLLWVGDIGDNFETTGQPPRVSVAFWRIDLGGDRIPVIHRFTYPDQPADAEALLLDADGTPLIITKSVSGTAALFRPTELRPSSGLEDTVPLEPVGEVTLPEPEIEVTHRLGPAAGQVVTGAANAPDGSAVVLRSYTEAFEYEVTDGDVAAALTTGEPLVTPLPEEPLGEAISYPPDGERFLTVSEVPEDSDYTPVLLGYTPTAPPEPTPVAEEPAAGSGSGSGGGGGLLNDLQDILNLIAAVGVLGLLLVAAGVFGIVRARRARPGGAADAASAAPPGPVTGRARLPGTTPAGAAGTAAVPVGREPPGGEPGPAPPGGVYTSRGGQPAGTEYGGRGTEYGGGGEYRGGEYRGGEYGADPYHGGGAYRDDGWPGYHNGDYPPPEHRGGGAYHGPAYHDGGGGTGHQYRPHGYPERGYPEPFDQDWPGGHPEPPPGPAGYPGGGHAAADYYSDDPDYPYEFRGR